jgi:hypothetical protein
MSMIPCPCCGGRGEIEERAPVELVGLQFKIFDEVRRHPHGIDTPKLVDCIYADRIDGGPDSALKTIHVMVWQLNRKLAKAGLRVANTARSGGGGVYKLQRLA